jgi:hypothetical protein
MSEIQELILHDPDMMHDRFYIEKKSKSYQTWERSLRNGDEVEFFFETENAWLKGTVDSWFIDDASGNAPGANAHFFLVIERDSKKYKLNLYDGLRIKINAPTDEALIEQSVWCEGGDYDEQGPYAPPVYARCDQRGKEYIAPSGQHVWYCDGHKSRVSDTFGETLVAVKA